MFIVGTFKFFDLAPSEYYVKPLMKEYEFAPSSQAVQIASGEDKTVSIKVPSPLISLNLLFFTFAIQLRLFFARIIHIFLI